MGNPPKTTIIFQDFPIGSLLGLDLDFFYQNDAVKGIKNIESGIHIFHFSIDHSSYRSGFYIVAKENEVIVIRYDKKNENMLINDEIPEVDKYLKELPELYQFMIPHESSKIWTDLARHISESQLNYILPKKKRIDSLLTSTEENNRLLDALQQSAKNRNLSNDPIVNSIIDQTGEEIGYTIIDLTKSIRTNRTASEITKDALDKSWFLENLLITGFNNIDNLFLGEFELSYLNMILFANHSSTIQWLKIIKVIFNTTDLALRKTDLFYTLTKTLVLQLKTFPEEYSTEFIEEDFWRENLSNFDYNMKDLELHKLVKNSIELKNMLKQKFNIDVDSFDIEDEYAPVIVDA